MIITNPPAGEALYTDYSIKINGQSVPALLCRVSAMPYNTPWPGMQRPLDQTEEAAFVSFESDKSVTMEVTYKIAPKEVLVRPLSANVQVTLCENTATFILPEEGQYTIEADGFHNALHVFFDEPEDFSKYEDTSRKTIRYKAGIHHVGRVELESNTTVIIDRNAVVYGSFLAIDKENITICGYGIIDGSEEVREDKNYLFPISYDYTIAHNRDSVLANMAEKYSLDGIVRFYACENVKVIGVTARDCSTFCFVPANCRNVLFENIKTIGMWKYNADGIDVFNCTDVTIKGCFLRNFDDCIVIKGICGWDLENNENIIVEKCVVWCDWGRNLELGAETNAPEYKNILFKDCDLIHGSSIMLDIQHHNYADIHDVTFQNIRCEYTKHQLPDTFQSDMNEPFPTPTRPGHPLLMCLPIYRSGLFNPKIKNGKTHDIIFKDIKVLTDDESVPMPESSFVGISEENSIKNVTIKNVTFNGEPKPTKAELRLNTNEFVYNVTIE